MADIYADDYRAKPLHVREFGNAVAFDYSIAKAAAQNDKHYFGIIPAGTRVDSVALAFEDCGTGVTYDLGYEPADGASPAAALQYWFAGLDVATAAGRSTSIAHPITFERDVKLVGTVKSAAFTGTPRVTPIVHGQAVGQK